MIQLYDERASGGRRAITANIRLTAEEHDTLYRLAEAAAEDSDAEAPLRDFLEEHGLRGEDGGLGLSDHDGLPFVGDGHWAGAYVVSAADRGWLVIDRETRSVVPAGRLVLCGLDDPDADPDDGLNQACLAADLDGDGLWLVDGDEVAELLERYGVDLEIHATTPE
jgi:hypothetical protein